MSRWRSLVVRTRCNEAHTRATDGREKCCEREAGQRGCHASSPRAWSGRPAARPEPGLGPGTAEARRVQDARAAEAPEEKHRARRCHPLL